MNVYSVRENHFYLMMKWVQCNQLTRGDPGGSGSLPKSKCWPLLQAWWGLSCGDGQISLGERKFLRLSPCTMNGLLLSTLNKHWENWGTGLLGSQDSDFIHLITNNLWHSGTFSCIFRSDPMKANSESFIHITHPHNSLPPISNLFLFISLNI